MLQCSAFLDFHLPSPLLSDNKSLNRNQLLKVHKEIQFIFFNTPHLHFCFFLHCVWKIHFSFSSHDAWLTFVSPLLHFLMHTYNRESEISPKPCVGGPSPSELHSQAAFNINRLFSLWSKCKTPRLLGTLKTYSCFCKECKIWKKAFQVCMCCQMSHWMF